MTDPPADAIREASVSESKGQPVPTREPLVEALIDRAGDWQARMFDYEVAGSAPTDFEKEAQQLIADLMLCVLHPPLTRAALQPTGVQQSETDESRNLESATQSQSSGSWTSATVEHAIEGSREVPVLGACGSLDSQPAGVPEK